MAGNGVLSLIICASYGLACIALVGFLALQVYMRP